jgi:hypothetical protein
MRSAIVAATVMMLITLGVAQRNPLPPTTIMGASVVHRNQSSTGVRGKASKTSLPFCPNGKCLYYAGDCDSTSPNSDALFDIDNPGIGISDAEVWVGVKPTKNAVITGSSGNYNTTATGIGVNPTPFAVRTGVSTGNGGKLLCRSHGNAVIQNGPQCFEGNNFNYYIAKFARACHVKAGKTYYVDLTPQYNDSSTVGYLWDDDGNHGNRQGWPEITDHSYFNSSSFGVVWEPTWGSSGACGGIGCSGFSISLTGKQN